MWDPSGRILTQTAAEAARLDAPPRAKQYKHVAHGSDLMAVFRDQYTPWDFSLHTEGLDIEQHVGALLLRLPLSGSAGKEGAHLGGRGASLGEVGACLAEFESAARSLLFLRRVQVRAHVYVYVLDGPCPASHPTNCMCRTSASATSATALWCQWPYWLLIRGLAAPPSQQGASQRLLLYSDQWLRCLDSLPLLPLLASRCLGTHQCTPSTTP